MANTDSKELGVTLATLDAELDDYHEPRGKSEGTAYDKRDMQVMGKLQELRVRDEIDLLFAGTAQRLTIFRGTFVSSPSWVFVVL